MNKVLAVAVLLGLLLGMAICGHADAASPKTVHFVLVSYYGKPAWGQYREALRNLPAALDARLAPQGLALTHPEVHFVSVKNAPGKYHVGSLIEELQAKGLLKFTGNDAWYLFSQELGNKLPMGGTVGGDWFGQGKGKLFPGLSAFGGQGIYALTYNKALPGAKDKESRWTRDMAIGAILHELGHNLVGLPDVTWAHKGVSVMSWDWNNPKAVYATDGWVFGGKEGNEREALIKSGFMRKVKS